MGLVENSVLLALNRIKASQIGILGKIEPRLSILSIVYSNPFYEINIDPSESLDMAYQGQLIYIYGTNKSGFRYIHSVDSLNSIIRVEEISEWDRTGQVELYGIDASLLLSFAEIAILTIENVTQNSFTGEKPFVDYISGNNSYTAILKRKNIKSINSVELVAPEMYYNRGLPATISVSDLNEYQYKNKGILQFESNTGLTGLKHVKYFPSGKNNIKVTGTYGFDEVDIPTAILTAISLETSALFLMQDANEEGGLSSFSIDGYSESYSDQDGRFGKLIKSYRTLAKTLINPYKTGVQ